MNEPPTTSPVPWHTMATFSRRGADSGGGAEADGDPAATNSAPKARIVPSVSRAVESISRVSSRGATVIIEEPAESLSTANAIGVVDQPCTAKEFVAEPLVIPFGVVMLDVLGDGVLRLSLPEQFSF